MFAWKVTWNQADSPFNDDLKTDIDLASLIDISEDASSDVRHPNIYLSLN